MPQPEQWQSEGLRTGMLFLLDLPGPGKKKGPGLEGCLREEVKICSRSKMFLLERL